MSPGFIGINGLGTGLEPESFDGWDIEKMAPEMQAPADNVVPFKINAGAN